jgi:hypothetical protein
MIDISVKTIIILFSLLMFKSLFEKKYFLSGVFASLCILTWQVGGLFIFIPFVYYIWCKCKKDVYIKHLVGFAIPIIIVVAYFYFNGVLSKLINYPFLYNIVYKQKAYMLKNTLFSYFRGWIAFSNTEIFFLIIGGLGVPLYIFYKREYINKELIVFLLPFFLLFLFTFIDFQAGEDIIPLVPIIAVSGAFTLSRLKIPHIIVLIVTIIYGFFPYFQPVYPPNKLLMDIRYNAENTSSMLNVISNYTYPEIVYYSFFHRKGWEMNLEHQLELAEYIKDNTEYNDEIFSLGAAELNFLSQRRNINERLFLSAGVFRYYAERDNVVDRLKYSVREKTPKFIVAWNISTTPKAIKFLDIEGFLENNYEIVNLHQKYLIWKIKDNATTSILPNNR